MSKQADISVIIPSYNLENYIGATLESLLLQEGVTTEILVIDDSSTDNTKAIVQQYAQHYTNIHLFNNERSKGVSGARNTGLSHMSGKTCFFLDGDDLLPKNALAPMFNLLEQEKTPIAQARLTFFCHQRLLCFIPTTSSTPDFSTFPNESFVQFIYKSSFLKENSILFPEDCSMGEDKTFFCKVFSLASEKTDFIPQLNDSIYIYRLNHKKIKFSTINAISFITHFHYIQNILHTHNRMDLFPSYVQKQLLTKWIHYAYSILQDEPTQIHTYLESFSSTFGDLKETVAPILLQDLKDFSDSFWQACQAHNTTEMLHIIKKIHPLQTVSPYIGIKAEQIGKNWKWIRLLHRIKNLSANPKNYSLIYYIYSLERKSRKFLKKNLIK